MASGSHTRRNVFAFDDAFESDNELLDMTMVKKHEKEKERRKLEKEQKPDAALVVTSATTDDDEDRVPPPVEEVSDSASSHPDFASWKREMADALLGEPVAGSTSSSSPPSTPSPSPSLPEQRNKIQQLTDWKTARSNKRREKKLKLQDQLRSVNSDTSNDNSNGSSSNQFCNDKADDTSMETHPPSSRLQERSDGNNTNRNSPPPKARSNQSPKMRKSNSEPLLNNIYVRREKVGMARRRNDQSQVESLASPSSKAVERSTQSVSLPDNLSRKQNNKIELAAIMKELVELKMWATKSNSPVATDSSPVAAPSTRLRQPTPPSSPTSPPPPASRDEPEPWTEVPSLEVPKLVSPPASPKTDKTKRINKRRGKGLTVSTTIDSMEAVKKSKTKRQTKMKLKMKMKKNVRFTYPEITDTIYRPKTPREDINTLFFQEDELLEWEYDEATTLRDRFEVIVTEVEHSGESSSPDSQEKSPTSGSYLNIGTPVISFHNSFSYSFQESDDDTS
mmetsp:Transcript_9100/g.22119  ORF Transcript_9100/g.22119 Transcript_9100/m.22119 type:complete len:507 (+) Transcript_9100:382-1902(+)